MEKETMIDLFAPLAGTVIVDVILNGRNGRTKTYITALNGKANLKKTAKNSAVCTVLHDRKGQRAMENVFRHRKSQYFTPADIRVR
jgi:hypothetical protein